MAIYEATSRPRATFVALKSQAQQELSFLHRSRLIEDRTQLINQIRSFVRELGLDAPKLEVLYANIFMHCVIPSLVRSALLLKGNFT